MAEVFKCPACSAPLEFEGKMMQKCKFCQSSVIVPSELMQNSKLSEKEQKLVEIRKLIESGNKIYAIKLFHETFGKGLKESKDAVDAMERGENISF